MASIHALRQDFQDQELFSSDLLSNLAMESYTGELNQLRQQSSWLSHLVDILPAGVVVLDARGRVKDANKVALEMLGEPLEGEKWTDVIKRSFRPRSDDGHEVSLHDGRRVKLAITALAPQPGQLILMTDLTETRILQERIAQMQRLSSLGKMVASLAHQVRTPLSAAMLYAANLGNERLTPNSRKTFQCKLTERLNDLEHQVNDMLLFAKSGSENQVVKEVSLQNLLAEVRAGSEAMVLQNNGKLYVELPEPDILILGNKVSLASAIQNLIHNSIQVIGNGAEISISAYRAVSENEVVISVRDNGPGIAGDIQEKIFEPFYTTRSQGTGLGLAVVKSVCTAHHGRVSINGACNTGAEFLLHIPIIAEPSNN
ncbi:sensor histidine kinase [Flocculibacter collagenilyticus]|uniref:sensor histidine kinase n=1 Tax=Flocculibacter collagenilyticus TaxID=2744479 RepID=UPI001F1C4E61|nr:ATP-binding protein [Flocculibacter collagenilyticus]